MAERKTVPKGSVETIPEPLNAEELRLLRRIAGREKAGESVTVTLTGTKRMLAIRVDSGILDALHGKAEARGITVTQACLEAFLLWLDKPDFYGTKPANAERGQP